jgi:glyoxylase-like metal-dependent hydrolase (beta-lactamase superfamily II)
MIEVGSFEILPVLDATFRTAPSNTYRGEPADDVRWEQHRYLLDDDGKTEVSMGGFLIRGGAGDRVTLVDLGLGNNDMLGASGGAMLDNLRAWGHGPEDVTDVIFTHLHLDHIGWASVDGEVVFPNATYRCDYADWDFWVRNPPTRRNPGMEHLIKLQKDLMEPAESRLETWDHDGPVLPGIDILRIPGHTPGSSIVVVSDGGKRAMMIGDVVHCAVELTEDEWDGYADVDPEAAKAARNAWVREMEGLDVPVAAAHFGALQFGRILPGNQARRFEFLA